MPSASSFPLSYLRPSIFTFPSFSPFFPSSSTSYSPYLPYSFPSASHSFPSFLPPSPLPSPHCISSFMFQPRLVIGGRGGVRLLVCAADQGCPPSTHTLLPPLPFLLPCPPPSQPLFPSRPSPILHSSCLFRFLNHPLFPLADILQPPIQSSRRMHHPLISQLSIPPVPLTFSFHQLLSALSSLSIHPSDPAVPHVTITHLFFPSYSPISHSSIPPVFLSFNHPLLFLLPSLPTHPSLLSLLKPLLLTLPAILTNITIL